MSYFMHFLIRVNTMLDVYFGLLLSLGPSLAKEVGLLAPFLKNSKKIIKERTSYLLVILFILVGKKQKTNTIVMAAEGTSSFKHKYFYVHIIMNNAFQFLLRIR